MKCDRCGQEAFFNSPTIHLCEACFEKKFYASFPEMEKRGLIERHGENWRITEKGRAEVSSWDEAWEEAKPSPEKPYKFPEPYSSIIDNICEKDRLYFEAHPEATEYTRALSPGEFYPIPDDDIEAVNVLQAEQGLRTRVPLRRGTCCSTCGRSDPLLYPYRGKAYCHECLRQIVEVVDEQDKNYGPAKPQDYAFWPKADEETRGVAASWTIAEALRKGGAPEEIVYAWHKCGFFPPDLVNRFRESFGEHPIPSRLTEEELAQWDKAVREYREKSPALPESQQWVLVNKLENGQTSVLSKGGVIDVQSHEGAKTWLGLKIRPSQLGYLPDGSLYGSEDVLGKDIIHVVGREAVPRTDYNPHRHDTFHLKLGPFSKNELDRQNRETLQGKGLLVDLQRPDSAFDVMGTLRSLCTDDMRRILAQAHPIVWTPQMSLTAFNAVNKLTQSLKAERDLVFLNPAIWLFAVPFYEGAPAGHATVPFTDDGHIPFPDEIVGDLGVPVIAILFRLTDSEIVAHYFYYFADSQRLEIRQSRLPLGSEPGEIEKQATLKWLRFAASPYLIITQHPVHRHVRRRAEGKFEQIEKGVGIILLRRAETIYSKAEKGEGEKAEINWSCQWWVSGFWRNQPCGQNRQSRKLTWIAPYIKGPPDKPLKEAVRLMAR